MRTFENGRFRPTSTRFGVDTALSIFLSIGGIGAAVLLAAFLGSGCGVEDARSAEIRQTLVDQDRELAATSAIDVPFKLKQGGDEVHLKVSGSGDDSTTWGKTDVPDGKSWARLPDGTGIFGAATPTKLATNAQ